MPPRKFKPPRANITENTEQAYAERLAKEDAAKEIMKENGKDVPEEQSTAPSQSENQKRASEDAPADISTNTQKSNAKKRKTTTTSNQNATKPKKKTASADAESKASKKSTTKKATNASKTSTTSAASTTTTTRKKKTTKRAGTKSSSTRAIILGPANPSAAMRQGPMAKNVALSLTDILKLQQGKAATPSQTSENSEGTTSDVSTASTSTASINAAVPLLTSSSSFISSLIPTQPAARNIANPLSSLFASSSARKPAVTNSSNFMSLLQRPQNSTTQHAPPHSNAPSAVDDLIVPTPMTPLSPMSPTSLSIGAPAHKLHQESIVPPVPAEHKPNIPTHESLRTGGAEPQQPNASLLFSPLSLDAAPQDVNRNLSLAQSKPLSLNTAATPNDDAHMQIESAESIASNNRVSPATTTQKPTSSKLLGSLDIITPATITTPVDGHDEGMPISAVNQLPAARPGPEVAKKSVKFAAPPSTDPERPIPPQPTITINIDFDFSDANHEIFSPQGIRCQYDKTYTITLPHLKSFYPYNHKMCLEQFCKKRQITLHDASLVDPSHCYVLVRQKDDEFQIQRDDSEWIRLKELYRITDEDKNLWLNRKDYLLTESGLELRVKKNNRIYLPCVSPENRHNHFEHSFYKFILTKFARKYNVDLRRKVRVRYTCDGCIQIRNRRKHWVTRGTFDHVDHLTHLRRLNSEEGFNEELKRQGNHVYAILPLDCIVSRKVPVQLNFSSFARRHNVDVNKKTVRIRIQSGCSVDVQNRDGDWLLFYDFEHSNLQQTFDTYGECLVSTPTRKAAAKVFAPPNLLVKRRTVPLSMPQPLVRISIDPQLWEETNQMAMEIVQQLYPHHVFGPMGAMGPSSGHMVAGKQHAPAMYHGSAPHLAQSRSATTPHAPQDYQHHQPGAEEQFHATGMSHHHSGPDNEVGQSFMHEFEHQEWHWDDAASGGPGGAPGGATPGLKRKNQEQHHDPHQGKRPRMEEDYHFQFNMDDELAL